MNDTAAGALPAKKGSARFSSKDSVEEALEAHEFVGEYQRKRAITWTVRQFALRGLLQPHTKTRYNLLKPGFSFVFISDTCKPLGYVDYKIGSKFYG